LQARVRKDAGGRRGDRDRDVEAPPGWIWTGVPFAVQVSVPDVIEQDTLPVTALALPTAGAPKARLPLLSRSSLRTVVPEPNNAGDVDGALPT